MTMRHPLDFSLVAVTLWLLVSMIIDAVTPKWLTVYMIGIALAPLLLAGVILHFLNWRIRYARLRKRGDRQCPPAQRGVVSAAEREARR
ncbi:hypothetical protein [Bradyrhizobium sp. Tv2a-2]|uniref:hypothetical protein n=1 Tax=Bradyrhizobium sp. Tv2a-2 TaxID=113395 RepID=UPI00040A0284|nr:hypothetical protein [Bradyrhizobium sp. Tv2a-2]